MATFQFSTRQIELDFCGEIKLSVPLTDDIQSKVQESARSLLTATQALKNAPERDLGALCDLVMDAIDDILGDGTADQILALKGDYTFWDAADVFKYITDEINAAFHNLADKYASAPNATPMNRAQRRAQNKA